MAQINRPERKWDTDFWGNIPEDCKQAIKELERLKVYGCIALDHEETFADVWWLVLHEVDLYVEGEFGQEAWHNSIGGMNKSQARNADKWLIKWLPLFNKYQSHHTYGGGDFYYSGQVE